MVNDHQIANASPDMLREKIRTLEMQEKMMIDRYIQWKKTEEDMSLLFQQMTGKLAVLSEVLNSIASETRDTRRI